MTPGFTRPVPAGAHHRTRGPVTVSLEPYNGTLECAVTAYFDDAPDTSGFNTGLPEDLPEPEQARILDRVLGLVYPLVMAGKPIGGLLEELAALKVPPCARCGKHHNPAGFCVGLSGLVYGGAMPSELLDPEALAAIEPIAVRLGLDPERAVALVEQLVLDGVLIAPLAATLAPEAEARVSLARFGSMSLPEPSQAPPAPPVPVEETWAEAEAEARTAAGLPDPAPVEVAWAEDEAPEWDL